MPKMGDVLHQALHAYLGRGPTKAQPVAGLVTAMAQAPLGQSRESSVHLANAASHVHVLVLLLALAVGARLHRAEGGQRRAAEAQLHRAVEGQGRPCTYGLEEMEPQKMQPMDLHFSTVCRMLLRNQAACHERLDGLRRLASANASDSSPCPNLSLKQASCANLAGFSLGLLRPHH